MLLLWVTHAHLSVMKVIKAKRTMERKKNERKEKNRMEIGRDSHLQYGICIWFNAWLKMHGKSHSLSRFGIFLVFFFFFSFYFAFFHGYLHTYIWKKISMLQILPFAFTCRLHKKHISTLMIPLSYSFIPSVLPSEWNLSFSGGSDKVTSIFKGKHCY